MKNKKKDKGLIITIVILIILLLVSICCLGYGYLKYKDINSKYDKLDAKYEDTSKQLEKANKNLKSSKAIIEESTTNYITTNSGYNLYSTIGYAEIIGYKGGLYLVESFGNIENCTLQLVDSDTKITFKKNVYNCKSYSDEDKNAYIMKLDIKESEIYKAFVTGFPGSSDPQYSAFLIYKNGEVKLSHTGEKPVLLKSLANYKIKDIKKLYCSGDGWENCGDLKLDVVLQDGTEKTINNFKYN